MIDRAKFFEAIRHSPFLGHLTDQQVQGMSDLLNVWERVGWKSAWYPAVNFANIYRETGGLMWPVREGFKKTDEEARQHVLMMFNRGIIHSDYAAPSHGHSWFGRGRVQTTFYDNYVKVGKRFGIDCVNHPEVLLDSAVDAEVAVVGHLEGIWTGHKLSDYLDRKPPDLINSRRCINGTDHAQEIAGVAKQFFADFTAAGG